MEDNIGEEYQNYWETSKFLHTEELERSWGWEEAFSGCYDSSSPDGAASSMASKNIDSERNRRKKLNERLFALRAVVPNITKMDKASIIKDAIDYIQDLHEQERRIEAEIAELQSNNRSMNPPTTSEHEQSTTFHDNVRRLTKMNKAEHFYYRPGTSRSSPIIELHELRVSYVGERTVMVSLSCRKSKNAMVKLCEVFESLKLKIITANITAFSDRLSKTVFIEGDEEAKDELKVRIETAIATLNDPQSPMSI